MDPNKCVYLLSDILNPGGPGGGGGGAGFADDFLNMMAGGGLLQGPSPAYLKFTGPMLQVFNILTDSMKTKGNEPLLEHGKFTQTYSEGADELKQAPDFEATEFDTKVANKLRSDLAATAAPNTPQELERPMKEMVDICSNYLAQHAEHSKHKGKSFKHLVKSMKENARQPLYQKNKASRTMGEAAAELEKAKSLKAHYDDPNLSQEIHGKLSNVVKQPPSEAKADMPETLDLASKYLSQRAVEENERGPAFDHMIKTLETAGGHPFTPDNPHLATNYNAAAALKSAPGLTSVVPDAATAPMYEKALHKAIDAHTPPAMAQDMKEIIEKSSRYLSAYGRDRGAALMGIIEMMKKNPTKEAAKRNNYAMNYGEAAKEIESAPTIASFLPVMDIADEVIDKLHKDMEKQTAPDLALATKTAINDVGNYLSQPIAMRSGAAGDRYPRNFLGAIMKSFGNLPLFKHKGYGMSYADAADNLKSAGPLETHPEAEKLAGEITAELNHNIPKKLAPTVAGSLKDTGVIDEAAKHLAKTGMAKGNALGHLTGLMKAKGDLPLGVMQGYEQSYQQGAVRLENANSLAADKVDKGAYASVNAKLHALHQENPAPPEHQEHMPGIIEDSSKYLSSPMPENEAEKRQILADIMARKGSEEFDKEKVYKISYIEAGAEIQNAPVGTPSAKHKQKAAENEGKINAIIPNKKLQEVLKSGVKEGAAHLANTVSGRGEAMQEIHDAMKKEGDKEFMKVGDFSSTHGEAAGMVADAKSFEGTDPKGHPVLKELAAEKIAKLDTAGSPLAKQYMDETKAITAGYIAGVATKKSGLDPEALSALDSSAGGAETDEERSDRLEAERRRKLGLPLETAEERAERIEAERRRKLGLPPETDEERAARRKKQGFAPETEAQRLAREKLEKERNRPGGAGAGADAEERSNRLEAERKKTLGLSPKTDDERADRLEAERRQKLGLPPETYQERMDRLEAERRKRLGLPPETEEERNTRIEAERRKRLGLPPETEQERLARQKLERERRKAGPGGDDPERIAASDILHSQLRAKGNEVIYKQPQTVLTHGEASDWLKQKPPFKADKTVRVSGDTARLSNKFERKLSNLVAKVTPPAMQDTMQDVIIESARNLAEGFVTKNYKTLVKEGLISEMQKKGNEILITDNGASETCFFAAQRLKKASSYDTAEPCDETAYYISKKLDEIIRCRTMARKLTGIMKEHIKEAAAYLSALVTKPDSDIEAYVALLGEMEVTGDALLIEGNIPKSYKDAAAYLRTLTMYEDQINRSDSSLQASTQAKLMNIMANVPPRGYQSTHMANAITYATKLLVSYIKLQGEKTEALKFLTERLKEGGSGVLLRHGVIRKSYADGADLLKGKNADQLNVTSAEPVVTRKIQIKLLKLVHEGNVPAKFQDLIDDLIEDTTLYLAVNLLQPRVIQVCKCMKNVFVQCELWCDEILRRVARPCCTCSRHVSAPALADLTATSDKIRISPNQTVTGPGLEITFKPCPSHRSRSRFRNYTREKSPCPANVPSPDCSANADKTYDVHYLTCEHYRYTSPPRHDQASSNLADYPTTSANYDTIAEYPEIPTSSKTFLHFDVKATNHQQPDEAQNANSSSLASGSSMSYYTPASTAGQSDARPPPFWQAPASVETDERSLTQTNTQTRTPIVSTDQMADWHAMMVSLMWNVQAWRGWIQENIDRALNYRSKTGASEADAEENWVVFQRRVATEALQWRQYNIFSRQLTMRLALRYKDKRIVSPTRATNQTGNYMRCQVEMLDIFEMFNRWTQWLTKVVQETNSLSQNPGAAEPIDEVRWKYFKNKVLEYLEDWTKYNNHLKVFWENKYNTLGADWLTAWRQPGPVWVVSACGAVPSGAVSAGLYDNEMIWVARTTHRCNVLPAALHPSKHCCVVYADGGVHHYTKYQVMCNAEVTWQAWRAGGLGARAVRVAPGTHVGRVHYRGSHLIGAVYTPNYRCHVVIFGRPFAFNCYELLVLKKDESTT